MSDKAAKKTEAPEKVMTSYDRKMQRRQEEKEREKKEKMIEMIVGVVLAVAVVALIASVPIRRFIVPRQVYVTVGGEDVTRQEFDYHYNLTVNNYISQYGSYLSYFGLDTTKDFSSQMYSDTMTWKDYFEEMTVDGLIQVKALKAAADRAGFVYDADEEIELFEKSLKDGASGAGLSTKDYLRQLYGSYATMGKISSYMREALRGTGYYDKIAGERTASDGEIQSYYEEHKDDYDSVDFYQTVIRAELPTEPTELADPVDETAGGATADGTGETAYQPSEAEIAKAMEDAKKEADAADAKAGELQENRQKSSVSYLIRDWLFDEARKENDTTVIEDTSGNQYYVLAFKQRYLDNSATADLRVIVTQDTDGQVILNEWMAGDATEDSFKELFAKYSSDASYYTDGGLLEGVTKTGLESSLADWIFAEGRATGDATSITTEAGYTYVVYYVGEGAPEWKNSIKTTLLQETMEAYMDEISADIKVEDKKGRLNYLKIRAAEEASGSGEAE